MPGGHHEQALKAEFHLMLELITEEKLKIIAQAPQRKVTCIVAPVTRNITIGAVLQRHFEKLPDGPGITVPHKLHEQIAFDHIPGCFG